MVRMSLGFATMLIVSMLGCGTSTQPSESSLAAGDTCPMVDVSPSQTTALCRDNTAEIKNCGDNGVCGGKDAWCYKQADCAPGFICVGTNCA